MYHSHSSRRKWFTAGLMALAMGIAFYTAPVSAATTPEGCKKGIASASATFEKTKLGLLQKCEAAKLSGKLAASTDCHAFEATGITKAIASAKATISKACTGIGVSSAGFSGLVKRCSAGDRWGGPCGLESECPGICVGGAKTTQSCSFTSSCNNRTCTKASCVSGDGDKLNTNCTSDADCFDDHVVHALGACPFGYECGQPAGPGLCNGGPTPSKVCAADSDCGLGGTCDAGCGANTSTADCQAGYCDNARCASNKDCGICNPIGGVNPPNFNEPCAADTDCGKVCPAAAVANANLPCKTNADCGGSVCGTLAGSCSTGTCTNGYCAAGNLNGHARATTGLCLATDRCPNFENNKEPGVQTCDGGPLNGQVCTGAGSCDTPPGGPHSKECNNTHVDCTTDADCGTGACVDRCQAGCGFPLNDATASTDIANCLLCIGEAAVDQVDSTIAGNLKPEAKVCVGGDTPGQACVADSDCPGTGVNKAGKCKVMDKAVDSCKAALASAAATFYQGKRAILEKCEEGRIKGTIVSCPDTTADTAIAKAEAALKKTVAGKCGGKDGLFESNPNAKAGAINFDLKPDQASGLFTCPNLGPAPSGPAACSGIAGQPITTAEDLAKCVDCIVEFKVDCTDSIANGSVPVFCNPLCGNGKIDGTCTGGTNAGNACISSLDCPGGSCTPTETCDDGNSVSGDTCPATCNINSCAPSGNTRTVIVTVSAPAGTDLQGLSLLLTYPDGTLAIPGQSNEASVLNRVIAGSGGGFLSANDLNYAIRLSNAGASIPPVAFAVTMDTCTGASPATSDQFRCSVESASDSTGGALTDVTCSATIL